MHPTSASQLLVCEGRRGQETPGESVRGGSRGLCSLRSLVPQEEAVLFPPFVCSPSGLLIDLGAIVSLLFSFSSWVKFTDPWYVVGRILVGELDVSVRKG